MRWRNIPADVEKYEYAADEIDCERLNPALKQWARNVHEAGAKMLVTILPTPDLLDDGAGTGPLRGGYLGASAENVQTGWATHPAGFTKRR